MFFCWLFFSSCSPINWKYSSVWWVSIAALMEMIAFYVRITRKDTPQIIVIIISHYISIICKWEHNVSPQKLLLNIYGHWHCPRNWSVNDYPTPRKVHFNDTRCNCWRQLVAVAQCQEFSLSVLGRAVIFTVSLSLESSSGGAEVVQVITKYSCVILVYFNTTCSFILGARLHFKLLNNNTR